MKVPYAPSATFLDIAQTRHLGRYFENQRAECRSLKATSDEGDATQELMNIPLYSRLMQHNLALKTGGCWHEGSEGIDFGKGSTSTTSGRKDQTAK